MIDNFETIKRMLKFPGKNDVYVLYVMRRAKDANKSGKSEMIKAFYINSVEYFEKKKALIKELADCCSARVYLNVEPKDNYKCMLNIISTVTEHIANGNLTYSPEGLISSAYCGYHHTALKRFLIDLDNDEVENLPEMKECIKNAILESYEKCGIKDYEMFELPTKNGVHLVCSPFNVKDVNAKYPRMAETYDGKPGLLKKHAMTLVYCPEI